jgi:hypothetical protein
LAPMRPTPTKPILEDFIGTKLSHPANPDHAVIRSVSL